MDHNIDESAPDLAGTGMAALTRLQEWGLGEVGLVIFHMPQSTRSCLGRLQCLVDPPWYAVVECLSLANIIPIALRVEGRAQTLQAREIPTVNPVSRDVSTPPWGLLVGRLASIGGKGLLGWEVIL